MKYLFEFYEEKLEQLYNTGEIEELDHAMISMKIEEMEKVEKALESIEGKDLYASIYLEELKSKLKKEIEYIIY